MFSLLCAIYWFAVGKGRRYLGALPMLFGAVLLAITTLVAIEWIDLGSVVLVTAVVASVSLGWFGYGLQRRIPCEPSDEPIVATLVQEAAPSTNQSLRPEDVLGPWQFYVDAAAGTVTVDLRPDGRYEQVIVGNAGERIEGPGGEWTLDGTNLELTDYRSATRGVAAHVRWCFGDWSKNPILFVKDDPHSKTMLLARRQETAEPRE
jgi:hypothetical protein